MKMRRLFWLAGLFVVAAFVLLMMKVAYPHHRLLAGAVYGLGFVPFFMGLRENAALVRLKKHKARKKWRRIRPYAVMAILLAVFTYVALVLCPVVDSELVKMDGSDIRAMQSEDVRSYQVLRAASDSFCRDVQEPGSVFRRKVTELSAAEKADLLEHRQRLFDGSLELDLLKGRYHTFYQLDYLARPELHADSFYLAYAAYVTQYRAALTLQGVLADNASMAVFLDEADAARGIPAGFWSYMERWLTEPDTLLRLNAGAVYLPLVKQDISFGEQAVAELEADVASLYKKLGKSPDLFLRSPLDLFEKGAFQLWFPVQKSVAVQMSLMRTATRDYLITPDAARELIPRLEPGDWLIERRNWHMTNVGIPGFWPHVALYVGTPEEVDAYFDGLPVLNGARASAWLQRAHSTAVLNWAGSSDLGRFRVIEALRDGIIFQPFEKSVNCDYLGVLRPKVTKAEKLQALARAFSFYGRSYDYNFDFATDNELVCSELIYKAYQSAESLTLQPQMIQGRELLPPNILVKQALDPTSGCADPVLFIDAVEKENRSFENSADKLLESWNRPKWDIMQN